MGYAPEFHGFGTQGGGPCSPLLVDVEHEEHCFALSENLWKTENGPGHEL